MLKRPRRLRAHPLLRDMVRETSLQVSDLIMPVFIHYGSGVKKPIASMPGIFQMSLDMALKEIEAYLKVGIHAIILFGIPEHKDPEGSDALRDNGIISSSLKGIKARFPELFVIADCCFCEYTDHGHCGPLETNPLGEATVNNDRTLDLLGKQAIVQANAGADMIAPSGMMDGMVKAIRTSLDEAQLSHLPIMSYAVKYASAFYGPFREAAQSHMTSGDRKTYQMDIANAREALREASLDETEGADILMVKPALPYLDILKSIRERSTLPLAAYQVSGEYAMLKSAAQQGWLDERTTVLETLTAIKRAGADMIITYFAYTFAKEYR